MNWARLSWLLACGMVVAYEVAHCGRIADSILQGECGLLSSIALAALGLPLTAIWWVAVSAAGFAFSSMGIQVGLSPAFDAIASAGFVVVGYVQWFVLLPWLWRSKTARTTGS
jgi:hypothetical protein